MKKLLLLAVIFISYHISAQTPPAGSLFIQNYTPHFVGYVIWKSNMGSPATGCTPVLEARNIQNDLMMLAPAVNSSTPSEANYESNVNLGFAPNPTYPATPLIERVNINNNFNPPYNNTPSPIIATFSNLTTWTGMKIGITNTSGVNIGGYYFMGETCGSSTVATDLSAYPNPVVNGSYFSFGGATWAVFF
ncbi:hypothetical protein ACM39_01665 [Chryseobacterium sp. FH2]|uniref:hypothetical protein n=1 Tax=Chryseobacterium sp. FH2 TaxID=1674291 RepID=UPI00065A9ADB|nr:hypothetical protein [Chryseobacterium sp. FH2]KMQ69783.1 hypothetical protein ACM39_01665 [Chryseobacterium sp. FH2]